MGPELELRRLTMAMKRGPRKPMAVALSKMPAFMGGFDPCQHKTLEDLCFMAVHEIDLWVEGEESDIQSDADLNEVAAWLRYLERKIAAR
jgi:hypothetical protein